VIVVGRCVDRLGAERGQRRPVESASEHDHYAVDPAPWPRKEVGLNADQIAGDPTFHPKGRSNHDQVARNHVALRKNRVAGEHRIRSALENPAKRLIGHGKPGIPGTERHILGRRIESGCQQQQQQRRRGHAPARGP
jgi:dihydroxyacetone kinase